MSEPTNPVIWEEPMYAYPFKLRQYKDGTFDAAQINGPALSPGFDTLKAAVNWVKEQCK